MKYIIMLLMVVSLAMADFLTDCIKDYILNDGLSISRILNGSLKKFAEIIIMATACDFEYGLGKLGQYYDSPEIAQLAEFITAMGVFACIAIMEIISILENYAEINPKARWVKKFRDKDK
ncbi:MAG: phage holin family protein [Ruminococcus flavefaciens]|nr:phage holin family protein [Ruminococcus flavefaciens]